jgi:hypothetical protein
MEVSSDKKLKESSSTFKSNISSIKGIHRFHSEFRFDVIKSGQQRITWIHLSGRGNTAHNEENEFDEGISMPPYSQNELQIAPGDYIELAVQLSNMNGIVDINSLIWEPPVFLEINPNERDPLSYNRDLKIMQGKGDRKVKI